MKRINIQNELGEHFRRDKQRRAIQLRAPCPNCHGVMGNKVIDSRYNASVNGLRRRRECMDCRHRWTTYEFHTDKLNQFLTPKKLMEIMGTALDVAKEIIIQQLEPKVEPLALNEYNSAQPELTLTIFS